MEPDGDNTMHNMASRFLIGVLVIFMGLVAAEAAQAGTMNFSVYIDHAAGSGSNNTKLYMYSTAYDNSSGCAHSAYSTTARIYSPSGRLGQTTTSGLSASTNLVVGAEYGSYTLVTNGTYNCSCIGGGTGGYGGTPAVVAIKVFLNSYQKAANNTGCPVGVNRYNAFNCTKQCMESYKCLFGTTKAYAEVRGWILGSTCITTSWAGFDGQGDGYPGCSVQP
jgi:hypothetical protein